MNLPLYTGWTISGSALPERLRAQPEAAPAFALPGAQQIAEFADLLGFEADAPAPEPNTQAAFPLPALFEADIAGCVTLSREIDFSSPGFDRAQLILDMVCGRGEVWLAPCPPRTAQPDVDAAEPERLAIFRNQPLTLELTSALAAHRRCRVELRFEADRPAGVCGAVTLRRMAKASFARIALRPQPALQTMTLDADIAALHTGEYLLRAQLCPAVPAAPGEESPIREMPLALAENETKTVHLAMEARCSAFRPGTPFNAPALKLWLFSRLPSGKPGALCDEALLLCGFAGSAPESWLPLTRKACAMPPETLLERLHQAHISAISLPAAASDALYRLLTRAGVAVRQTMETDPDLRGALRRYPCVTFEEAFMPHDPQTDDASLSAWRLCGLVTYPRTADPDMTPADLLRDAAGRAVDPADPATADVLAWLRAVSVRLRSEAIRQGALRGAFCAPDEWDAPDVFDALQTALAPLHLSALPLCGAWWTGSRFSASLQAFIPQGRFPEGMPLRAVAALEDSDGHALARVETLCPASGGALGLLEAVLPERACVLELVTRLYAGEEIAEESVIPVYVGDRGPLEAAF